MSLSPLCHEAFSLVLKSCSVIYNVRTNKHIAYIASFYNVDNKKDNTLLVIFAWVSPSETITIQYLVAW